MLLGSPGSSRKSGCVMPITRETPDSTKFNLAHYDSAPYRNRPLCGDLRRPNFARSRLKPGIQGRTPDFRLCAGCNEIPLATGLPGPSACPLGSRPAATPPHDPALAPAGHAPNAKALAASRRFPACQAARGYRTPRRSRCASIFIRSWNISTTSSVSGLSRRIR